MRNRNPWIAFVILTAAAVAAMPSAAGADQPPAPRDSKAAPQPPAQGAKPDKVAPAVPANSGGVVVFVDPATGKIVQPTDAQIGAALPPPVSVTRQEPSVMIIGPGGAVGAVVPPESFNYSVATRAPNGGVTLECVTGKQAAVTLVNATDKKEPAKDTGPLHDKK